MSSLRCSDEETCIFQFGERLGIFITVLAATLSAISVIGLLTYAAIRRIKKWKSSRRMARRSKGGSDASAFSLLLSLVTADLVQAIGGMPGWRWMLDAHLTEGPLCTFQSLFLNVGNVATAFSALSIAIHTFAVLILRWRVTRPVLRLVVAGIWCATALIVGVSNRGQKHYYGGTGYWCWITQNYGVERVLGEYLWMWIAFTVMIILYVFMFLIMRGIIRTPGEFSDNSKTEEELEEEREAKEIAYLMLFYPAVYLFCIAPVSISRWLAWSGHHSAPGAILFGNVVFSLSGFLNVVLFSFTRPKLVTGSTDSLTDSESAGNRFRVRDEDRQMPPVHRHTRSESTSEKRSVYVQEPAPAATPNDPEPPSRRPQPHVDGSNLVTTATSTHTRDNYYLGSRNHGRLPD